MSRKLVTDPRGQNGRKLIRSMNGQALNRTEYPPRYFWTYDDQGENDPYLSVMIWRNGFWTVYGSDHVRRINIGGQPVYTSPKMDRENSNGRFATYLGDSAGDRKRGMTFWIYGAKIHVYARNAPPGEIGDNFIGTVETEYVQGKVSATVNGVYRGLWPVIW